MRFGKNQSVSVSAEQFSDAELLAQIISPSEKRTEQALTIARRALDHCGGLNGLSRAPYSQLITIKGIGRARALRILSALEFSKRAQEASIEIGDLFRQPADVARMLIARHAHRGKEVFGLIFLDVKNRPRGYRVISVGTLDQSLVHPREVFKEAITERASKVILFHNHPSGDPNPSQEDIIVTQKLCDAGKMLNIPVLDHLIVSEGKYVSLREQKVII